MTELKEPEPLIITEDFDVSPDMLYRAWTEEEPLKEWWKPTGSTLSSVKADMSPGGQVTYDFTNADFRVTGQYESVEPPVRLKYSWNWEYEADQLKNESFVLDISFKEKADGTLLSVRQEGFKNQEQRAAHEEGWKRGLQQLREYFAG